MLATILTQLGIRRVARELGVQPGTVHYWKVQNRLPDQKARANSRARYERAIARLAGMSVAELRTRISA